MEHEEREFCPEGMCDGSGFIARQHYDNDAHEWHVDGDEPCPCQK